MLLMSIHRRIYKVDFKIFSEIFSSTSFFPCLYPDLKIGSNIKRKGTFNSLSKFYSFMLWVRKWVTCSDCDESASRVK